MLCAGDALALGNRVDSVGSDIAQRFCISVGPSNGYCFHYFRFAQPKMNPQVILRQIASPAPNFVELGHAPAGDCYPRSDGGAI